MDLSVLDKKSTVTPMLVRLYDTHKLYALAKDKKPLARTELCGAVCDLLDFETSGQEANLIADVLIALVRQAEKDLRAALSERLSIMENIPLTVALHLANDDIEVAKPVLTKSDVLGDLDLMYIIKSKTPEYWQAIAERKQMSDQLINVLAETREVGTVGKLLENHNIILPELALNLAATMVEDSDTLAKPLLYRSEVTSEMASRLYNFVGHEIKRFIVQNYNVENEKVLEVIDEVVLEFKETAASEFTPSNAMVKAAERYNSKGLLTFKLMMATLRRGQMQSFIAQFAVFSKLPVRYVEDILKDKGGRGLALICKAHDVVKPDFVTLFLLTNRIRQNGRMVDVSDMSRAIAVYNKYDRKQARDIVRQAMKKNR